ncbi:uncharacterized protein BXZ73DRAFT_107466 [Epithele typhae]|uniref:uncharacterized protein n=1 Tax=Epithele typhae TaxID=378194 RepID=UPI0020074A93|nr:uncharacterized protein BXZ73DRAFT_107466 [Epithele typhae]KAH9912416.1 hypothetical protein BXZ73DRAFT_107466 [Epithele typhae]
MSATPSTMEMLTVCRAATKIHYALCRRPNQTDKGEKLANWFKNFFAALDSAYDFQAEYKFNTWPCYTLGAFYEYEKGRRVKEYKASPFNIIVGNDHGDIWVLPTDEIDLGWCYDHATVTNAPTSQGKNVATEGAKKLGGTRSGNAKSAGSATIAGGSETAGGEETAGSSKTTGASKTAGASKTTGTPNISGLPDTSGNTNVPESSTTGTTRNSTVKRFHARMSRTTKKPAPTGKAGRKTNKDKKGKGRATAQPTTDNEVGDAAEEDNDESEEDIPIEDVRKTRKKVVTFKDPDTPAAPNKRRAPSRTPDERKKAPTTQPRANTGSPDAPPIKDDEDATTKKKVKRVTRPKHPGNIAPEPNFEPFPNHKDRIPVGVIKKDGPNQHLRCERCKAGGTDCRFFVFDGTYCCGCRVKKVACENSPIAHGKLAAAAYRAYRAAVQLANPARYPDPVLLSRLLLGLQDCDIVNWFFDWFWDFYELNDEERDRRIANSAYHLELHVEGWTTPIKRIPGDVEVTKDSVDYPKPRRERKSGRGNKSSHTKEVVDTDAEMTEAEGDDRGSSEPPAKKRCVNGRSKSVPSTHSHVRPPSPALDPRNQPPPPPGFDFRNVPLTTRVPVDPLRDFQPESHVAFPTVEATMRAMQAQMNEMAREIAILRAAMIPNQSGNAFAGGPFMWPAIPNVNPFAQYQAGFSGHGGDEYSHNGMYFNHQAHAAGLSGANQRGVPQAYGGIADVNQYGIQNGMQSASPSGSTPSLGMDWAEIPVAASAGNTGQFGNGPLHAPAVSGNGTGGLVPPVPTIWPVPALTMDDGRRHNTAGTVLPPAGPVGTTPKADSPSPPAVAVPLPVNELGASTSPFSPTPPPPHDTQDGKTSEADGGEVSKTDAPAATSEEPATAHIEDMEAKSDAGSDPDADGQDELGPNAEVEGEIRVGIPSVKESVTLSQEAGEEQDMDISA